MIKTEFECWEVDEADNAPGGPCRTPLKLTAYDARTAAELYVEKIWDPIDGPQSVYEISVRDHAGDVSSFVVNVEAQPVFVASPVRRAAVTKGSRP